MRYAETDQMGVVYYANYLIWMELGRAEYCRAAGIRYRDMEVDDGILLAVVEAHCRYLHPARYDEEIAVKTWVVESEPAHGGVSVRDSRRATAAASSRRAKPNTCF